VAVSVGKDATKHFACGMCEAPRAHTSVRQNVFVDVRPPHCSCGIKGGCQAVKPALVATIRTYQQGGSGFSAVFVNALLGAFAVAKSTNARN
jgi:hypothetical protein